MVSIKVGVPTQAVLQGAQHILFVEGRPDGLDVSVLGELLSPRVRVAPLGASFSVRSVATALHEFHPQYWFLIDRDEWDDDAVEASWRGFPDPESDNLLIWRRKELESYFLEPDWVTNSRYLKPSTNVGKLTKWLEEEVGKTIWFDAANRVIVKARNSVKRFSCELLQASDVIGRDRDEVAERLVASRSLTNLAAAATSNAREASVRHEFHNECELLTGGTWPLSIGVGLWRDLVPAKMHFRRMINQWFVVPDQAKGGKARLTGREAERAVAVDLLKNHHDKMPSDLSELKRILEKVT